MRIPPISSLSSQSNKRELQFGHSNELKTLFKKGKFPSVKFDAGGNLLTKQNVTLDHIIPVSKGGKNKTTNFMLAVDEFNHGRGNDPLLEVTTKEGIFDYLKQFVGVKVGTFIGNNYIKGVLLTLQEASRLGV